MCAAYLDMLLFLFSLCLSLYSFISYTLSVARCIVMFSVSLRVPSRFWQLTPPHAVPGLMTAFSQHISVVLYGPPDCGKSLSGSVFAAMIGRPFVNFNCTHRLDYQSFSKLLKGVAATGAWMCLHAFDRVTVSVMSAMAEMLAALQRAVAAGTEASGKKFRLARTLCGAIFSVLHLD